jgi:hypothetical protein
MAAVLDARALQRIQRVAQGLNGEPLRFPNKCYFEFVEAFGRRSYVRFVAASGVGLPSGHPYPETGGRVRGNGGAHVTQHQQAYARPDMLVLLTRSEAKCGRLRAHASSEGEARFSRTSSAY